MIITIIDYWLHTFQLQLVEYIHYYSSKQHSTTVIKNLSVPFLQCDFRS